jgi:hypothetical protein
MPKTLASAAALAVLAAVALLPSPAQAIDRPPMKSCGDFAAANGLLFADVLARRVTCRNARRVARRTPRKCGLDTSSCSVRRFSCLVARVGPELRFARCSKPGGGDPLFKTIRFEFGS